MADFDNVLKWRLKERFSDIWDCEVLHPKHFETVGEILEQALDIVKPGWIPVSQDLPKKPKPNLRRGWYLVALESGCVMSLGFEYDGEKWFNTASPVTHWMPLPEPPKEGEQNG